MSERVEWFVRDRYGDSWTCAGESDARTFASNCDDDFPLHAPHRVIKRTIVEVITDTEEDVTDARA